MITTLPVIDRRDGSPDDSICKGCVGLCCTHYAGIAYPHDFGPRETLTDVLVSYFETGFWCADYWEGDVKPGGKLDRIYFIRPQHTNARGKLVDPSWGGVCSLWALGHGCSLQFQNRPHECRHLVADPKREKCVADDGGDKAEAARRWRPFQSNIKAALRRCGYDHA